jgi:tol-pal system protein YbgF
MRKDVVSLRTRICKIVLLVSLPAMMIGCVTDEDLIRVQRDLKARIDRVDARVTEMEKSQTPSAKEIEELRSRQVDLYNSIEEIRASTQEATGSLERQILKAQRSKGGAAVAVESDTVLTREVEGLDERVARLEQMLGVAKSEGGSAAPAEHAAKPVVQDENAMYNAALNLFRNGKYEAAQTMFTQFIDRYPKSQNADNAQFWIGECLSKRKEYGKAILEYQKVVEKYSKGNKVPDALLKQALAFKALGDKTSAQILLKKIITQYAKSPQAKVAQKELAEL